MVSRTALFKWHFEEFGLSTSTNLEQQLPAISEEPRIYWICAAFSQASLMYNRNSPVSAFWFDFSAVELIETEEMKIEN